MEQLKRKAKENDSKKNRKIGALRSKPDVEQKWRTETRTVYRGGLGFLDWLLGPKEVTERVQYNDDSEQKAWERKKKEIENSYDSKKRSIASQNRVLEQKIEERQTDIKHIERMDPQKQSDIRGNQELLQTMKKNLERQKELALKEYLRNLRDNIMDNVRNYLNEGIRVCMSEDFEKAVAKNKEKATEKTVALFEMSFDDRVKSLEQLVNGTRDEAKYMKSEETLQTIEKTEKLLEGYLCQA